MLLRGSGNGVSWLLVFLGNPGPRYRGTRHNAGFRAAELLEERDGLKIDRLRFRALTARCELGGASVLLMKPQTYMNLSGEAVQAAMRFYKVPLDHVIVISDEVSLPAGKLRVRRSGSAGGHNGLRDIIEKCGGEGFPRIRVGVGSPPVQDYDMKDWVLGALRDADAEAVDDAAGRALDAAEMLISQGVDAAMNRYNG